MWLVGALLLLVVSKIGMQFWIANKGFDIWDEGWYIIILNFYKHYPTEPHSYYGAVLDKILPIEFNLINLRLLCIATEVLSSIFFCWSFFSWISKQSLFAEVSKNKKWLLLLVLCAASFTGVYTRAFSYNDFSYFLTLTVSGIVFWAFPTQLFVSKIAKTKAFVSLTIIGCLLAFLLIVKFSSSILLLGWVTLFMLLYLRETNKLKVALTFTLATSKILFLLLYFGGLAPLKNWLSDLAHGISLLRLLAYDTYSIFVQGYIQVDIIENGLYYFIPLLSAAVIYRVLQKNHRIAGISYLLSYVAGIIVWLMLSMCIKNYFLGEFHYRFIALHIYTLAFLGLPSLLLLAKQRRYKQIAIGLMFVALPYIALFGSNNPTTQTLTKYLVSWYSVVAILLLLRFSKDQKNLIGFSIIICLYSIANYTSVQLLHPYGLHASVFEQTEKVDGLHYLDGVYFDKQSAAFFNNIRDVTQKSGYTTGNTILGLGDLCGAVVSMGGYMPETFWYFSDENAISPEHSRNYSCMHLSNLRISEHKRLPLVYINSGIHQQVIDCLINSEIPFPERYQLKTTIFNPYAQESLAVWAPLAWELPTQ